MYSIYIYIWVFPKIMVPNSSILIGFSIINHPFWGTPIFGNTHIVQSNHSHSKSPQYELLRGWAVVPYADGLFTSYDVSVKPMEVFFNSI